MLLVEFDVCWYSVPPYGRGTLPALVSSVGASLRSGVLRVARVPATAISAASALPVSAPRVGMVAGWRGLGAHGAVVLSVVCGFGPSA
jgi:hypothetical protein